MIITREVLRIVTRLKSEIYLFLTAILITAVVLFGYIFSEANSIGPEDEFLYMPDVGFVPDDSTAIRVAEAIWLPIYGESIQEFTPFKATLKQDSVWVVEGTLPHGYLLGGTPYAEISKSDCRIIKVTFFK